MKYNQQVESYLLEQNLVQFLARHSLTILRVALGVIYLWFGFLKFFPGLSPAEDLALRTVDALTFGLLPATWAAVLLALLECTIGLGFITGKYMRLTLLLMAFQMAGAMSPLILFPGETLGPLLIAPTLEGQYIIKNLVLIGAALVIAATLHGGHIVAEPYERERQSRARRGWEATPVHQ
jgi:uncharacterized membrane protein YphA (DoxX/SURF4 family)